MADFRRLIGCGAVLAAVLMMYSRYSLSVDSGEELEHAGDTSAVTDNAGRAPDQAGAAEHNGASPNANPPDAGNATESAGHTENVKADAPAVSVVVFIDPNDPANRTTVVTLKVLAIRFKNRGVAFEILDPTRQDHYTRLTAMEKAGGVTPEISASVETFINGKMFAGADFIQIKLAGFLESLINPKKGALKEKAPARYAAAKKAAIQRIGDPNTLSGTVTENHIDGLTISRMTLAGKQGAIPFFLVYVYTPITCPVCADTEFFITIDGQYRVVGFTPIRDPELYNRRVDPTGLFASLTKCLNAVPVAFPNRNAEVDGISGATKTNNSYITACRILAVWLNAQRKKAKQNTP